MISAASTACSGLGRSPRNAAAVATERRRFATDLDHLPLKQLMKLGGWKTPDSVIRYQKPTTEQLRASLKTRRNGARHRKANRQ